MGLQLLIDVLPIGPVILDLEVKRDGWRQCYHTAEGRGKMRGGRQLGGHREETLEGLRASEEIVGLRKG